MQNKEQEIIDRNFTCAKPRQSSFVNRDAGEMHYPDRSIVPSSIAMEGCWDREAVFALIRSQCADGESPAFLLLGRKELDLLRNHLAEVFGEEAVTTLKGTHYMGLEVVEVHCESFLRTDGRKTIRTLQDPISRRPAWRDW